MGAAAVFPLLRHCAASRRVRPGERGQRRSVDEENSEGLGVWEETVSFPQRDYARDGRDGGNKTNSSALVKEVKEQEERVGEEVN